MLLKEFAYKLPKDLIAQHPITPRDHSRLLVLDRKSGKIEHKHFYDLPDHLKTGDVLVLNNTKVFPARLIGKKSGTGGKIEIFLLKKISGNEIWECLVGGHGRRVGLAVNFDSSLSCLVKKDNGNGTWQVRFNKKGKEFVKAVEKIGRMPLPPYIKRLDKKETAIDRIRYQTVFVDERKAGSVAAPTASLHFTKKLLSKLKKQGVQIEYVTLHVGLGTFAPVKAEKIEQHQMHAEWVEIDRKTLARIIRAKKEERRIVAVGTTSVRTLESVARRIVISSVSDQPASQSEAFRAGKSLKGKIEKYKGFLPSVEMTKGFDNFSGWTNIFIHPGYKFKIVDAMITNFHLPKSTLLMLVSAFVQGKDKNNEIGIQKILGTYNNAIRKKYRFFSYGDAMLIK